MESATMQGSLEDFVLKFDPLVESFYSDQGFSSESFRKGPSLYFHKTTIEYVRNKTSPFSTWLGNDKYFHELLYATLTAWGMNRSGGRGPILKDFNQFQAALRRLSYFAPLEQLHNVRIENISTEYTSLIKEVFEELGNDAKCKIMASEPFVVASSKLLHHLIPDLFPPMDRQYTEYAMQRFNDRYKIEGSMESFENFWRILDFFHDATVKITPTHISNLWITGKQVKYNMNTSIPKVLDNAIVSYAWLLE
jgi:hypothetical protein